MSSRRFIILCLLAVCAFVVPVRVAAGAESGQSESALSLGQAVVLGVVEGLTEYLPVSSTGHLLLAERVLGIGSASGASLERDQRLKEASDAYTICIQIGAILAVLGLYFRRVRQMLCGLVGRDDEGRRMLINVLAGFLPAAVIGLLFNKLIKAYLFGLWPVVVAWLAGGLAILIVSRWNRSCNREAPGLSLDELGWRMALIIGFAQCVAMWPGVSRSLATIVGGLLVGLSLSAAVEFSFLLGLITLSAATAYDTLKHGQLMLQTFDALSLAVGVIVALIAALLSVKWMVAYLNRHGLALFGYYRVVLALATGALLIGGVM
jgi:undecaprenyl-diphosphatase